jgi:hypothetical protein
MPIKVRHKISASHKSFVTELSRLERFDASNQKKFSAGTLGKLQRDLLVESIFFAAFRSYEGFIREIFVLYTLEKQSNRKPKVKSYLKARNFEHAEQMIKSSMEFLDWTSPDNIINRSELFLVNGHTIKLPYTINRQQLSAFKKIRNHIAHNSIESELQFEKIVRLYHNGIIPLKMPTPADYLMYSSHQNPQNYVLLDFFALLRNMAASLT